MTLWSKRDTNSANSSVESIVFFFSGRLLFSIKITKCVLRKTFIRKLYNIATLVQLLLYIILYVAFYIRRNCSFSWKKLFCRDKDYPIPTSFNLIVIKNWNNFGKIVQEIMFITKKGNCDKLQHLRHMLSCHTNSTNQKSIISRHADHTISVIHLRDYAPVSET